jgi:hypothetical protein
LKTPGYYGYPGLKIYAPLSCASKIFSEGNLNLSQGLSGGIMAEEKKQLFGNSSKAFPLMAMLVILIGWFFNNPSSYEEERPSSQPMPTSVGRCLTTLNKSGPSILSIPNFQSFNCLQ